MRKLFVPAATVAVFALLVTPVFAKPGNGNGGGKGGVVRESGRRR